MPSCTWTNDTTIVYFRLDGRADRGVWEFESFDYAFARDPRGKVWKLGFLISCRRKHSSNRKFTLKPKRNGSENLSASTTQELTS